jgi:hypothetical protein
MRHLSDVPHYGWLLALLTNIRLGWQYLPETNTLAYYGNPYVYEEKKFYDIGARC